MQKFLSLSFLIFSDNSYEYDFGPSDFLPNKRYVITRYSKTNGMLESIITDEIYWITPMIRQALIKFNYQMPISVGPANADPIVIDTDEKGEPKKISKAKLDLNDGVKINELRQKWRDETVN